MATPNPTFNPMATTNAFGLFSTTMSGLVQGVAHPDPATRFALAQGYLKSSEVLPMWGGVGIFENVPLSTGDQSRGGEVGRATGLRTYDTLILHAQRNARPQALAALRLNSFHCAPIQTLNRRNLRAKKNNSTGAPGGRQNL